MCDVETGESDIRAQKQKRRRVAALQRPSRRPGMKTILIVAVLAIAAVVGEALTAMPGAILGATANETRPVKAAAAIGGDISPRDQAAISEAEKGWWQASQPG